MATNWLLLDSTKPLRYRKEVIHVGDFVKDDIEFSITPEIINHLDGAVDELLADGIAIPFAKGHAGWELAENRLGDVVDAEVEDGKLFFTIEFADEESRDLALRADVSVGLMDQFEDGRGKSHFTVIRHLAATSAPVIPALSEWHQIAASFNSNTTYMNDQLAELLGVEEKPELILAAIKELQDKAKPAPAVELSHSPAVVRALRDAREMQLSALVSSGDITPATKAEIIKHYATDKAVALDLSHGTECQQWAAVLDIAKTASKSQPLAPTGRSSAPGKGEVELSHSGETTYSERVEKWAADNKSRFSLNGNQ